MSIEKDRKTNKINDINAIHFGDTIEEVSSSLMIVMTLFEVDDDPEIIKACKFKLYEGIAQLKKLGDYDKASEIEKKVN